MTKLFLGNGAYGGGTSEGATTDGHVLGAGGQFEGKPYLIILHQMTMRDPNAGIFAEKYRVVAVESQSLVIRGVRSGEVLTILNPDPETPLTPAEYPPGKLIALRDPSAAPLN